MDMTQQTWEERWDIYCNGDIVDPIPFFRTELQKAREEERERIAVILQEYLESGYNDEILKKINQEDK